ncbi:MAG: hypothetical protein GWN84_16800 [Gammaproteobacteria bacterium]|nr:hypothetical protein [Gammaproteobacteria bacterium]NIR84497.1 hypothetical protein [Gammaproteobacteria bacterium]NIR90400.1 hypothetical protein [Gammaproteobacteria bacterium]NIU05548.1 hypothetical protein [Gammaproteobacteria bacterium]NIV52687.1 hypothetical protein [Gammaproteobacteria bacterium]
MRNRPHAENLLQSARELLLHELLDALPAEHRYAARMIANAMGIAARELAAGDEPLQRELGRLCDLLNQPLPAVSRRPALEHETEACNRELVRRIRAGDYDGASRPLRDHLIETTIDKLRESNPKYLRARGL